MKVSDLELFVTILFFLLKNMCVVALCVSNGNKCSGDERVPVRSSPVSVEMQFEGGFPGPGPSPATGLHLVWCFMWNLEEELELLTWVCNLFASYWICFSGFFFPKLPATCSVGPVLSESPRSTLCAKAVASGLAHCVEASNLLLYTSLISITLRVWSKTIFSLFVSHLMCAS